MPPKRKQTIQDIKPTKKSLAVRKKRSFIRLEEEEDLKDLNNHPNLGYVGGEGNKKYRIWLIAIFCVLFLIFSLSYLFTTATVKITPRSEELSLDSVSFDLKKDANDASTYQILKVSTAESLTIPGESTENVSKPATGTITLYNNYSTSPQRLVVDTRLKGSNNLIYKTKNAVTIPGQQRIDGKMIPGSVDVSIYADVVGVSGNATLLDFIIVGFEGSPKAKAFYGRGKTELTGGYTGVVSKISDATAKSQKEFLRSQIQTHLKSKLLAGIPEGFVLIDDSFIYNPTSETNIFESPESFVEINETGELSAKIIRQTDLAEIIAMRLISGYDSYSVTLKNLDNLIIKLTSDVNDLESGTINLSGDAVIVWTFPSDELIANLAGQKKRYVSNVVSAYPGIESATAKISPFWKTEFPERVEKIKIINTLYE